MTRALVQVGVVLLIIGALRLTATVTLPIAFSIFAIALFWPIYRWLAERVPDVIAASLVVILYLLVAALLVAGLWYGVQQVTARAPQYVEAWEELSAEVRLRAQRIGLDVPSGSSGLLAARDPIGVLIEAVYSVVTGFFLSLALFLLGLLEVHTFREKIGEALARSGRFRGTADRVAVQFQRYILIRSFIGLLTGLAVGIACWLLGLDFAFAWGLSNGLLNYIPTIGSAVALVLPTLFALIQFGNVGDALIVLVVIGGIQLLMGSYVAPLVQASYLRLSAVAVLATVLFWGWVWGPVGAFLAVPLTIALVLICREFDQTRWIAVLLARDASDVYDDPEE